MTPVYTGQAGGAAVYYQRLTSELSDLGVPLTVVSERVSTEMAREIEARKIEYIGLFPQRASKDRRIIRDVFDYGLQNLAYGEIPKIVQRRPDVGVVLVHTSFLNSWGIFGRTLRQIDKLRLPGCRLIGDCRDKQLGLSAGKVLEHFDQIISCSSNVSEHLRRLGVADGKIRGVAVIQETLACDPTAGRQWLAREGVTGSPVIFYPGLVKSNKGIGILIDAFVRVVRPKFPDSRLVLMGLWKARGSEWDWIRQPNSHGVHYFPAAERQLVLDVMGGADLVVNASPDEGMPRSCLEAIEVGARVLLPDCVPEFRHYCGDWVIQEREAESVGEQMLDLLERDDRPNYDLGQHRPDVVMSEYMKLFGLD